MDNEKFKLNTRRYVAWFTVGVAVLTAAFIAIWGAIKGHPEYVALGGVGLLELATGITVFYFAKKASEE